MQRPNSVDQHWSDFFHSKTFLFIVIAFVAIIAIFCCIFACLFLGIGNMITGFLKGIPTSIP